MVIPVVFLLLVVVSPTTAITLDTDGAFNARLVDAGGIGGGGESGLGLGFLAAPLIGLAVLAAIAGSTNTGATVVPGATTILRQVPTPRVCPVCPAMTATVCPTLTPCDPIPTCPVNYQRIGIPANVAGAGTVLQSCYRIITPAAPLSFRMATQLCTAEGAVPVEFNTAGEFGAVSALLGNNAGTFFTGHSDAFNNAANPNTVIGNHSGVAAVGVNFPAGVGGNNAVDCGVISGAANPASPVCRDAQTGIICEISLTGECFCPAGTG